jgi:uncharacterized protein
MCRKHSKGSTDGPNPATAGPEWCTLSRMTSKSSIDRFVQGKTLAMAGISSTGKGFGAAAYKELKARGYRVLPLHPSAGTIQGDPCWPSLAGLPEPVERLLIVTSPGAAAGLVDEAAAAGVKYVWLQQGAETAALVDACATRGLDVVHGQCILMFAEPVASFHKFHRWLWGVLGRLPRAS